MKAQNLIGETKAAVMAMLMRQGLKASSLPAKQFGLSSY